MTQTEVVQKIIDLLQIKPHRFKDLCVEISADRGTIISALGQLRTLNEIKTDQSVPRIFSLR